MSSTAPLPPKVCFTATGALWHEDKILLVEHKKLGIWLTPGGHIEENELPHKTAQREFLEETGVRVRAVDSAQLNRPESEGFQPHPITSNYHWINEARYTARTQAVSVQIDQPGESGGKKCEKHLNFMYVVELAQPDFSVAHDPLESTGIGWFGIDEVAKLNTVDAIRFEIRKTYEFYTQQR